MMQRLHTMRSIGSCLRASIDKDFQLRGLCTYGTSLLCASSALRAELFAKKTVVLPVKLYEASAFTYRLEYHLPERDCVKITGLLLKNGILCAQKAVSYRLQEKEGHGLLTRI